MTLFYYFVNILCYHRRVGTTFGFGGGGGVGGGGGGRTDGGN